MSEVACIDCARAKKHGVEKCFWCSNPGGHIYRDPKAPTEPEIAWAILRRTMIRLNNMRKR